MIAEGTLSQSAPACAGTKPAPAVDLDHLARQTMGDDDIRREVLILFVEVADGVLAELATADEANRGALAHRLLGAARGIGAHSVAAAAQVLEDEPASSRGLSDLAEAVSSAKAFIAGLR
ncbi:Hpt domain-containing protein [Mycoplana rhizolycopersici]|uniref:Hpt domain-containing protein n=1 Tax=Mycoplana rhizolycopersici TaxID=2746702 RepID=A0ABX2QIN7_9HYPH|nr:Hpt domain-containing protein [Rhizobium rhizolycopersici]NVP57073.1 Hpt domain-containing protein [Rhizobium rhizolycopersici]